MHLLEGLKELLMVERYHLLLSFRLFDAAPLLFEVGKMRLLVGGVRFVRFAACQNWAFRRFLVPAIARIGITLRILVIDWSGGALYPGKLPLVTTRTLGALLERGEFGIRRGLGLLLEEILRPNF